MLVYITQKYSIFTFLKSNTVLKVLFTLSPVIKDLEHRFTSERETEVPQISVKKVVFSISIKYFMVIATVRVNK